MFQYCYRALFIRGFIVIPIRKDKRLLKDRKIFLWVDYISLQTGGRKMAIHISIGDLSKGEKARRTNLMAKIKEHNSTAFDKLTQQEFDVLFKLILDNKLNIHELGSLTAIADY